MPTIAIKTAAMEGDRMFFSTLLPMSQLESIWLPIREPDSKKTINQNVSFKVSCLCPCCINKHVNAIIKIANADYTGEQKLELTTPLGF